MSYNIHVCIHLAEFVSRYGPLDEFSAFKFENFLGVLKRRIKPSSNIFEQTVNRMFELREVNLRRNSTRKLKFTMSQPDNCATSSDGEVILINAVSGDLGSGTVLQFSRCLYNTPYESSNLGIGFYYKSRKIVRCVKPLNKCILICSYSNVAIKWRMIFTTYDDQILYD